MEKMIYAILSSKNNSDEVNTLLFTVKGISGTDLYAVVFNEISMIVGDIKKTDLITDNSNAIEYAGVIETLAKQFTLLPVRFGSLMESTNAIIKILEKNYKEITQNLQRVENKYEFGLKIFCDSEKLKTDLKAKSEANIHEPTNPDPEIKISVFKDYVNRKLKEHRLEELLLTFINSVIAEITGHLTRLNTVSKFKKMTTSSMIIDAVFLLEKDKKEDLIQTVEDLQKQYTKLNFVLTGPWPPYSFVDFKIK